MREKVPSNVGAPGVPQGKKPVWFQLLKNINLSDIFGVLMILILWCKQEKQHVFQWQIRSKGDKMLGRTEFQLIVMTYSVIYNHYQWRLSMCDIGHK